MNHFSNSVEIERNHKETRTYLSGSVIMFKSQSVPKLIKGTGIITNINCNFKYPSIKSAVNFHNLSKYAHDTGKSDVHADAIAKPKAI